MVKGSFGKIYFGKETTYGTKVNPSFKIRFSSEDIRAELEKKAEGLLTGSKVSGRMYTMGIKGSGKVSTLARADEIGHFLKGLWGVTNFSGEVTTGPYIGKQKHIFTLINPANKLPSYTIWVDRVAEKYSYTGATINEIEFSAQPGDYLKLDINFNLKDESVETSLIDNSDYSTVSPFRFYHGVIKINGNPVADITSIKYAHKNNAEIKYQTTDTQKYYKQPAPGEAEITVSMEALWDSGTVINNIKTDWYKNDTIISIDLSFVDEQNNAFIINLPYAQITEYTGGTISGPDELKVNITAKAVDGVTEPQAILYNDYSVAY